MCHRKGGIGLSEITNHGTEDRNETNCSKATVTGTVLVKHLGTADRRGRSVGTDAGLSVETAPDQTTAQHHHEPYLYHTGELC